MKRSLAKDMWRGLLFSCFSIAAVFMFLSLNGCRSPLIEVNRTAPLIESHITANGNTVPVHAAP